MFFGKVWMGVERGMKEGEREKAELDLRWKISYILSQSLVKVRAPQSTLVFVQHMKDPRGQFSTLLDYMEVERMP